MFENVHYMKKAQKLYVLFSQIFHKKFTPKSYLLAELGGARALGVGAGCETPEFPSYAAKVAFSRSPLVLRAIFYNSIPFLRIFRYFLFVKDHIIFSFKKSIISRWKKIWKEVFIVRSSNNLRRTRVFNSHSRYLHTFLIGFFKHKHLVSLK